MPIPAPPRLRLTAFTRFATLMLLGGMLPDTVHAGFIGPTNYAVGQQPTAGSLGDIDGDGDLDLAVANSGSNTVSILRNNGNGTFAAAVNYATPNGPVDVTIGLANWLDGNPDLVVANQAANSISVFSGNGDGTFAAATHFPLPTTPPTSGPTSVSIGNLNAGSTPDLAVAFNGTTVALMLGTEDGEYQLAGGFSVANPGQVTLGDVNFDANLDVLIPSQGDNSVTIFTAATPGFFAHPPMAAGAQPRSLVLGDIHPVTYVDMAVANFNSDTVSVYLGSAFPSEPPFFSEKVDYPVGDGPTSLVIGDFNADAHADLAVANFNANSLSVLNGNGDGTLAAAVHHSFGSAPRDLLIGDLDADGDADLVLVNSSSANVSILRTHNGPADLVFQSGFE